MNGFAQTWKTRLDEVDPIHLVDLKRPEQQFLLPRASDPLCKPLFGIMSGALASFEPKGFWV